MSPLPRPTGPWANRWSGGSPVSFLLWLSLFLALKWDDQRLVEAGATGLGKGGRSSWDAGPRGQQRSG